MKTKNLNFLEAVKAVKDGLCEYAYSSENDAKIKQDSLHWEELSRVFCNYSTFLATDYELINPRVPTEDVEVKVWALVDKSGKIKYVFLKENVALEQSQVTNMPVVETVGVFQRPVKETVLKRKELQAIGGANCCHGGVTQEFSLNGISTKAKYYAEWEEEA